MKTIAFFNSIPSWGGGEKWHYETSLYFAKKGYKVYFFANPNGVIAEKLKRQQKVELLPVSLSNTSFLNPLKIRCIKNTLEKHHVDIVVINHPGDLKIAAHAAHLAKTEKIIYRRGSAIPIKNRLLNRYIFKHWVTDILANSQATKNTILGHNPNLFPEHKIKVIYNPIDIDAFIKTTSPPLPVPDSNVLLLGSLGRLAPQKNQFFLIDLSKKLKEKGIAHRIYLGGTGSLESKLKAYSKANHTEDTVIFLGFQSNVKTLLNAIDIFILPSIWEGFGYVLAEASLCKKPIVAFNLSSNPEIVIHNQSGYLIEKNNIKQAIDKIVLLSDKTLRDRFGEYGYNHCVNTFDHKRIMIQVENFFNT